jgi:hypothetical protein
MQQVDAIADVPAENASETGRDDCSARPYSPFAVEFADGPVSPRPRIGTSPVGTKRSLRCSHRMSVVGGEAENMCSGRVFRLLTRSGRCYGAT